MRISLVVLLVCLAAHSHAEPRRALVLRTPDSAHIAYKDECANGANNDFDTEVRFVAAMLAEPRSRLGALKVELAKATPDDTPGYDPVVVSEPVPTFHDRMGCGKSYNSFSFFVSTVASDNTHHTVVHALVTVDDDDDGGERTLKLRSIKLIKLRDEEAH